MVDRRRLRRLKAAAQRGGVVVQLRTGKTEVFSEHAPLALWALEVEEGMEAEEGKVLAPSESLRRRRMGGRLSGFVTP